MARKNKNSLDINIEELVLQVAKAVAKEVAQEMLVNNSKVIVRGQTHEAIYYNDIGINMDKIIPIAIEVATEESNVENAVKEEEIIDKDLEKSKSKLANIFKKKEK